LLRSRSKIFAHVELLAIFAGERDPGIDVLSRIAAALGTKPWRSSTMIPDPRGSQPHNQARAQAKEPRSRRERTVC